MPAKKYKSPQNNSSDVEHSDDLFSFRSSSSDTPIISNEFNSNADDRGPVGSHLASPASKSSASAGSNFQHNEALRRQVVLTKSRDNDSKKVSADPKTGIKGRLLYPEFNVWMSVVDVSIYFGVSKSTVWRWVKFRPNFPKGRKIGPGTTRWLKSEIEAYSLQLASSPQ